MEILSFSIHLHGHKHDFYRWLSPDLDSSGDLCGAHWDPSILLYMRGMWECLLIAVESLLPSVKETLCFCWRGLRWPWAPRPSQCPVLYAAPAGQWLRNGIGLISPWMDADRRTILVHPGRNEPTFLTFKFAFLPFVVPACLVLVRSETHVNTRWQP